MKGASARVGVHVKETELSVLDLVACYCKKGENHDEKQM